MDPLYLIEQFDAVDSFRWFICEPEWTRRNVIEAIADAQIDCVVGIREIRDDKTWADVTRDIAEEVDAYLVQQNNGVPPYRVLTFLHANGLRQTEMTE